MLVPVLYARFAAAALTKAQCDNRKSSLGPWLFYFLFFGAIAFSLGQSLWLAVNPDGLCPGGTMMGRTNY